MLDKKFVIIFCAMLLGLSFTLYLLRTEYTFKAINNEDLLSFYRNSKAEESEKFQLISSENKENYLVLNNLQEDASESIKGNVEKTLTYMKKSYESKDIESFKGDVNKYHCIILTFENIDLVNNFDELFQYVKKGGTLVFAVKPDSYSIKFPIIYRRLGIYDKGYVKLTTGIKLKSNLLIKGKELEIGEEFTTHSIPVYLESYCKIHAVSGEGIPLIWERDYGKGKIAITNGTFLTEKNYRGLLVGILSNMEKAFLYPIINAKVNYIDDFPAPIPEGFTKEMDKDSRLNTYDFYKDVWWPDMLKISKLYNAKYSGYIIETYSNIVEGDLKKERHANNRSNLTFFGRELLKSGGELGMHGYNHQPLAQENFIQQDLGYTYWKSVEDMVNGINEVKEFTKTVYENYTLRSYVPPSNIISPEGLKALKIAMPDLKVISSLYIGNNNSDEYIQEFDKGSDNLYNFPRFSSGYKMNNVMKWSIYNGITVHGVFSHFVHPDDILDPNRSGNESWEELKNTFKNLMADTQRNFGWLNNSTISEATVELSRYLDYEAVTQNEKDGIRGYMKNFKKQAFFILRAEEKINSAKGCEVSKIDDNVYIVKVIKPEFFIGLGDEK